MAVVTREQILSTFRDPTLRLRGALATSQVRRVLDMKASSGGSSTGPGPVDPNCLELSGDQNALGELELSGDQNVNGCLELSGDQN